jgi:hypothetical protein
VARAGEKLDERFEEVKSLVRKLPAFLKTAEGMTTSKKTLPRQLNRLPHTPIPTRIGRF